MTTIHCVDDLGEMGEGELEELYTWIDTIPLSRPKRNMARDFSDGVLVAEVIKHMFPRLVDMHNYTSANNFQQKMDNWIQLNKKVFRKLRFDLSNDVMQQIICAKPGLMECVLCMLRTRLERVHWEVETQQKKQRRENDRPEVDQFSFSRFSSQRDANITSSQGAVARATAGSDKKSKFPQDETVPAILLEEKEQELLMKDEIIKILQAKIKRLEHLLHLKDIRIEDLQTRVEAGRGTGKR